MSWTVYEHITPNGKRYIGITSRTNVSRRWKSGKGYDLKTPFRNAIEKYGWNSIEHHIISTDLTETEAKWLENYLICYYRTFVGFSDCKGYNCTLGGDGTIGHKSAPWNKGVKLTEEHKRKLSESNKGKQNRLGLCHSEETKMKMSKAKKGKQSPRKGKHLVIRDGKRFYE